MQGTFFWVGPPDVIWARALGQAHPGRLQLPGDGVASPQHAAQNAPQATVAGLRGQLRRYDC
jgi:hypothetical protein